MNFDRLTEFLQEVREIKGIPGVDCMVSKGGKIIYHERFGYMNREDKVPVSGDTQYYMFSSSKPITCFAALQLLEQGKFLMTDWITDYLPEFSDMTVLTENGVKKAENHITMKQLFTMTAGFTYNLDTPYIKKLREEKGSKVTTREMMSAIAKEPLLFEPGTHWSYGLEHDVLGAVIEAISGQTLGEYMEEHIFRPLGMKNTGFTTKTPEKLAVLYKYEDGVVEPFLPGNEYILSEGYESGGAGLISTTEDYMKFCQMMARGGTCETGERLIAEKTLKLMRMPSLTPEQEKDFNWEHFGGYSYGLGVRTLVDPSVVGMLTPAGEFGWQGAAGAYMHIDMENEIAVSYTQHMLNSQEPFVHPRLKNIIYSALEY